MKKVIIIAVIVLILVAVAFWALGKFGTKTEDTVINEGETGSQPSTLNEVIESAPFQELEISGKGTN